MIVRCLPAAVTEQTATFFPYCSEPELDGSGFGGLGSAAPAPGALASARAVAARAANAAVRCAPTETNCARFRRVLRVGDELTDLRPVRVEVERRPERPRAGESVLGRREIEPEHPVPRVLCNGGAQAAAGAAQLAERELGLPELLPADREPGRPADRGARVVLRVRVAARGGRRPARAG